MTDPPSLSSESAYPLFNNLSLGLSHWPAVFPFKQKVRSLFAPTCHQDWSRIFHINQIVRTLYLHLLSSIPPIVSLSRQFVISVLKYWMPCWLVYSSKWWLFLSHWYAPPVTDFLSLLMHLHQACLTFSIGQRRCPEASSTITGGIPKCRVSRHTWKWRLRALLKSRASISAGTTAGLTRRPAMVAIAGAEYERGITRVGPPFLIVLHELHPTPIVSATLS